MNECAILGGIGVVTFGVACCRGLRLVGAVLLTIAISLGLVLP